MLTWIVFAFFVLCTYVYSPYLAMASASAFFMYETAAVISSLMTGMMCLAMFLVIGLNYAKHHPGALDQFFEAVPRARTLYNLAVTWIQANPDVEARLLQLERTFDSVVDRLPFVSTINALAIEASTAAASSPEVVDPVGAGS